MKLTALHNTESGGKMKLVALHNTGFGTFSKCPTKCHAHVPQMSQIVNVPQNVPQMSHIEAKIGVGHVPNAVPINGYGTHAGGIEPPCPTLSQILVPHCLKFVVGKEG